MQKLLCAIESGSLPSRNQVDGKKNSESEDTRRRIEILVR